MRAALAVVFGACRRIVGPVDCDIDAREDVGQALGPFAPKHLDLHLGIDLVREPRCRLGLVLTDGIGAGEELAVEVGDLEPVKIGDDETANPGTQQRHQGRAPHPADAGDEDAGLPQPLLLGLCHEAAVAGCHLGIGEGGHARGLRRL